MPFIITKVTSIWLIALSFKSFQKYRSFKGKQFQIPVDCELSKRAVVFSFHAVTSNVYVYMSACDSTTFVYLCDEIVYLESDIVFYLLVYKV